jgi:hypothetical protein
MANKFTFKTDKPTGRYRSFSEDQVHIKFNKAKVGEIYPVGRYFTDGCKIRLMVEKENINEDNNPNCSWKNIFLKKSFSTIEEAKIWLNKIIEYILKKYKLHLSD